jgi:hypothetical protein
MRVYVTSSHKTIDKANEFISYLEVRGFEIGLLPDDIDWTVDTDEWDNLDVEDLEIANTNAIRAVMTSDAIVMIAAPRQKQVTSTFIIGMAIGFGIPVVIINDGKSKYDHFFIDHNKMVSKVASMDEACEVLDRIAKSGFKSCIDPDGTRTPHEQMCDLIVKIDFIKHKLGGLCISIVGSADALKKELPFMTADLNKIHRHIVVNAVESLHEKSASIKSWFGRNL